MKDEFDSDQLENIIKSFEKSIDSESSLTIEKNDNSQLNRLIDLINSLLYKKNCNNEEIKIQTNDRSFNISKINLLQSLIDSIEYGLTIQDRDYNIVFQNEYIVQIFGESKEKCYQSYEYKDAICEGCPVQKSFEDDLTHTTEREVTMPSGEIIYWENTATPIKDQKGNTIACLEIVRNITDRKKTEAQLRQSQKLDSIGRLAGGVAHDFNNMLSVILGYTDMVLKKIDSTNPIHSNIIQIHNAANRSAEIVQQLLAFARKQTFTPQVLNFNNILNNIIKILKAMIGEDIDIIWKPNLDLWSVKMDPVQIEQILMNLCVNARDAISGVGNIIIETQNININDSYCKNHSGFIPGDYIMIVFSDNGCGIEKSKLDNIFEPFFSTKEQGKGTGLGLATVFGIIKQNNGFINVYSEVDHGTTFKLYIPRYIGNIDHEHQIQIEKELPESRGETILIVEDEPMALEIIKTMLDSQKYYTLTANKPKEAITLANKYNGKIDLLITDVIMPEMNGKDLSYQINKINPHIKHLFMSGYTADVISNRGILDQGLNFIQKPFSIQSLCNTIRKILDE